MAGYLIHVLDESAWFMARYDITERDLEKHLESIEREFPGCSINIAPKHKEQQKCHNLTP
jgi:hypothetical protein